MWIQATRGVLINNQHTDAGTVLEVEAETAQLLIGIGAAVQCDAPVVTVTNPTPNATPPPDPNAGRAKK